jgi:hypothetical protein
LSGVGYDAATKTLEVQFLKTGKVYAYRDVPQDAATGLQKAESAGSHFLKHVKPAGYAFTVIDPSTPPATTRS